MYSEKLKIKLTSHTLFITYTIINLDISAIVR